MRLVWIGVVAGLLMPLPAIAQTVYVTDKSGGETKGRLVSWTGLTIVLRTGDTTKTFSPGEAVRVDLKGDSLKNGTLIGAAVGAVLGGLAAGIADCPSCGGASRVSLALSGMLVYTAIGTGIDALISGRTPLWRADTSQGPAGGLTLQVSPQQRRAFAGWTMNLARP